MNRNYGVDAKAVTPIENHPSFQSKAESSGDLFQGLKIGAPPMPGELSQLAKNMWVFIGKHLEAAGSIAEVDVSILRRYCVNYSKHVEAERLCAEFGEYQETPNGYQQIAPWAVTYQRTAAELRKDEDRLGLSPRSRSSIKTVENPNQASLDLG